MYRKSVEILLFRKIHNVDRDDVVLYALIRYSHEY